MPKTREQLEALRSEYQEAEKAFEATIQYGPNGEQVGCDKGKKSGCTRRYNFLKNQYMLAHPAATTDEWLFWVKVETIVTGDMTPKGRVNHFRNEHEEREANEYAAQIMDPTQCTITDGVARWNSNGACVPSDCMEKAIKADKDILNVVNLEAHNYARECETVRLIAEYKESQEEHQRKVAAGDPEACEIEAEHIHEMRAAFGDGETVVNVLTGTTYEL